MEELDINKLIEKTQEMISDGYIVAAEMGRVKIQDIEIDGVVFELYVTLKRKDSERGFNLIGHGTS